MKKDVLITLSVALLILALGLFWYYGTGDDVHIEDMNAPPVGVGSRGQLEIMLQNNGSEPVDVWLEVENAFVDENGESYSTSRLIISNESESLWSAELVSLQKPVKLLPGNNTVSVMLGYKLPGEYEVEVKVSEDSRLLDKAALVVEVPPPELFLELEYEKERMGSSDVYGIYGYLINHGLSSARDVSTNLTVINEGSGKTVFTSSRTYDVRGNDKSALWTWPDYPYAIVEIAHGKPFGESYMPVQNVVIGGSEDRFRINVTSTWQDQVVSAELLLPPGEEAGDAYD